MRLEVGWLKRLCGLAGGCFVAGEGKKSQAACFLGSCPSSSLPPSASFGFFFFFGGASKRNSAQTEAYATAITRQNMINPLVSEIDVNRLTNVSFIESRAADDQVSIGYPLFHITNIQNRRVLAQVVPAQVVPAGKDGILISAGMAKTFSFA